MYDARDRSASGSGGNLLFGLLTLGVVAGAFVAVWKGPDLLKSTAGAKSVPVAAAPGTPAAGVPASLASVYPTANEQRYLAALETLSPGALASLERRVSGGVAEEVRITAIYEAAMPAFSQNVKALAGLHSEDLDRLVDLSRTMLRQLSSSNGKLCKGATYLELENKSPAEIEGWLRAQGLSQVGMYTQSMGLNAEFMEMMVRAKRSPARHGRVTGADEQAVQQVMMSMMADPQIMQIMMSAQGGSGNEREILRSLDICRLGVSVLDRIDSLPADTKGRLWASAFDNAEVRRALRSVQF